MCIVGIPLILEGFCVGTVNMIISHLSLWFFFLQNLNSLILRENKLQELPPEIGQLTQLTALDVSHNSLQYLPEGRWGGLL